jgi:MFS family permease
VSGVFVPLTTAYRRYALAVVTAVYMLNLVDRGLMMLLLQPIKNDLQLSDTQLGFLTGIAFGLFYATLGIPLARWADSGNRVTITSLAIGLWGMTVMVCLLVTNYTQLVFARIAAAVGESGCKPPTYSLVGDYFPEPASRTRAMAFYMAGNPLSTLLSFLAGGWLSENYGWRMAFFLMGIPGVLLAILVKLTIVEPRTRRNTSSAPSRALPPIELVLRTLWRQRSWRHLTLALVLLFAVSYGLSPWYAAYMMRTYGMGSAELGVWFGAIFSLGGIAGALLGGYVASRWFAGNERGQMQVSALAVAAIVPFFVGFLTLPDKHQALLSLAPLMIVFNIFLGPTYAVMQRLVPDEMRATMMAVVMLLANLIGMGIGPQVVGILSDLLAPFSRGNSLRHAMLAMSFIALWAGYHFWCVGRTVERDLDDAERYPRHCAV